jgi:hypothetical protein
MGDILPDDRPRASTRRVNAMHVTVVGRRGSSDWFTFTGSTEIIRGSFAGFS